jgi:pimeloyl-ACP methyl ester carboxylesterase
MGSELEWKSMTFEAAVSIFSVRFVMFFALTCASALAHATVGHRVHTQGSGRALIIFASGLGDTLDVWHAVQAPISAECGRTMSYNRAGYAGSPPPEGPRDAKTVVAELREELRRQGLRPPYILVGHSLGGLYMQYFARQFASEVSGLVLVDSTHWNQQLLLGAPNERSVGRRSQVVLFMDFIARRELADSARAGEQVNASPIPGFIPTIVLSSTGVFRGETPAARAHAANLQEDIVESFTGARHIRVDGSGHYIQKDRPDVVIKAVQALAGCAQVTGDAVTE